MEPEMTTLTNQVAIVTGAGSENGIGFATARLLGEAGVSVVLAGFGSRVIQRSAELRQSGIRSIAVQGDLSKPDDAASLVKAALDAFGSIHILVNNAGMTAETDPQEPGGILGISEPQWRRAISRNLDTTLNATRAVSPYLADQRYGRIVMVSSVSGPIAAYAGDVGYHAAKAAIVGLMRATALELGGLGITSNSVAPGWIGTESATEEELVHGSHTPLGRSGTADEVAALIKFLASPEASYITGQLIVVDGGNSIQEAR
jgi:3-oxoacyl-[acyl-carrier protein] reductase